MDLNTVSEFSTMLETINYCQITPKVMGEYKWPSLSPLHYKCFDEKIENTHDSKDDVISCAECISLLRIWLNADLGGYFFVLLRSVHHNVSKNVVFGPSCK